MLTTNLKYLPTTVPLFMYVYEYAFNQHTGLITALHQIHTEQVGRTAYRYLNCIIFVFVFVLLFDTHMLLLSHHAFDRDGFIHNEK